MTNSLEVSRRTFLRGSAAMASLSALGMSGCRQVRTGGPATAPALPFYDAYQPLVPIRPHADRIFRITVCSRPFRAQGPRMEAETIGDKTVIYNYGHGGSGWSLSWGCADVVTRMAMEAAQGSREIAVIGAGALGLTSATMLQRAGAKVTIYAKERAPYTRSSRATGSWTPSSRIALASAAAPEFAVKWEAMARTSFAYYQSYLGMAGTPIEWTDRYSLWDEERRPRTAQPSHSEPQHDFLHLDDRISDLTPKQERMPPGSTPFPTTNVARSTSMSFNVADYSRQLTTDFLIAGGTFVDREFHSPQDFAALPEKVIVCCTGYGSRALLGDESIVPVRGQIAWLIPQDGAHYGINYNGLNMLARRDGIVMQYSKGGEEEGWNDASETPDRAYAEEGIAVLAELYGRMQKSMTHKS
jgi:glycine/D-amino acid oxidase-like deaminating enzyme